MNVSVLVGEERLLRTAALQPAAVPAVVQSLPPLAPPDPLPAATQAPLPPMPAATLPLQRGLSLADCENLALANNPSLAESLARVNALRGKWEQVGLAPNPYAGYSDQQTGSPEAEQRGVIFGQEVVRGNKLQLNRAVVCQEVQRAQQEYQAQQLRVLTDVRIAYFQTLAAQQRRVIAKEIIDSSAGAVTLTQKRLDAKEVGKTDLLQAKIEYETAQLLERRSQNQALEAWRRLSAVAGVSTLQEQPLVGKLSDHLPEYHWEPTLTRLLSASPEIAAAQAEIQRTRWAYQRAQAEKTSNLSFQGIVQDDRSVDATNGAIQLTMPIPIWNRNQGGITQAGHEALAAARALEKLELDLQQRLAVVFQRYQTARFQAERYAVAILPNARENLQIVERAYADGEYDYLDLLVAKRTFAQTELASVEALQEMHVAALEIEGLLLSNSLQASK